jgi:hypothetical protein
MDEKKLDEFATPYEEIEELKRQKDALMEELENIATAEWREFDPDTRRCAYEFVLWAQRRARHTLNRVLSGDAIGNGLTKEIADEIVSFSLPDKCPEKRGKNEAQRT